MEDSNKLNSRADISHFEWVSFDCLNLYNRKESNKVEINNVNIKLKKDFASNEYMMATSIVVFHYITSILLSFRGSCDIIFIQGRS